MLERLQERRNPSEPGEAARIGEAEALGGGARPESRLRIVELGQMDDPPVGAEIAVAQVREAVEAEALDDQRIEMPGEEVGEIEGAGLLLGERGEHVLAGEEGVAMGAGDAGHALLVEHAIEFAAGPAVAVEAQDLVVGGAIRADRRAHRLWDSLGPVVQARRQAGDVDRIEAERQRFARQGPAGDNQRLAGARIAARKRRRPLPVMVIAAKAEILVRRRRGPSPARGRHPP